MMWFDRAHPEVVFGDRRVETLVVTDRSHGNALGTRTLHIASGKKAGTHWLVFMKPRVTAPSDVVAQS